MALDVDKLAARYPILWHLTPAENGRRIRVTRVLESAATLMRAAGDETWLRRRRPTSVRQMIAGEMVTLRDQEPLHEGHIQWEGGWDLSRLVAEINQRVFFWPGDECAPIRKVAQNTANFRAPGAVAAVLVPLQTVRRLPGVRLQFSEYNAGAPRTVNGRKAPRGPRTFLAHGAWSAGIAAVREVAIYDRLSLDKVWDEVRFLEL